MVTVTSCAIAERPATMRKKYMLWILLFGGLWGLSEALLGGWMYAAGMRQAAPVVLAAVAFAILTVGRVYVPVAGSSTAIAALAMLFKFLNEPFFACHLLAIFLLGAGYDVVYTLARGRRKPLIGLAATYLGLGLFALIITYVVRYSYWISVGWPKVLRYVALSGSIAAVCNAVIVPVADRLARRLRARADRTAPVGSWAFRTACAATLALWAFALIQQL